MGFQLTDDQHESDQGLPALRSGRTVWGGAAQRIHYQNRSGVPLAAIVEQSPNF